MVVYPVLTNLLKYLFPLSKSQQSARMSSPLPFWGSLWGYSFPVFKSVKVYSDSSTWSTISCDLCMEQSGLPTYTEPTGRHLPPSQGEGGSRRWGGWVAEPHDRTAYKWEWNGRGQRRGLTGTLQGRTDCQCPSLPLAEDRNISSFPSLSPSGFNFVLLKDIFSDFFGSFFDRLIFFFSFLA